LHPQSGWTDDHELLLWYRSRDPKLARRDVTDAKALLGTATATWPITRPSSNEYRFGRHPTQKPERLLEVILAAHQGLVLDFCAGACTTAVAAVRRRRPVLCGDLNDGDGYLGTGRLRVAAEPGGSNDADPLRELAEWLTVECHLPEPMTEPRPNPAVDEFRRALLDPELVTSSSPTLALAHAIRRAVPDTRLLAIALGIVTAGPHEFASAWADALARLADESGDEYRSAGPPHALAEARDYLAGFCSELGVVEFDEVITDAGLAGAALAGLLRREGLR